MPALTITKNMEFGEIISTDAVVNKIETALNYEFNKVKIKEREGTPEIKCRVKTKFFNPIVSIKGPIRVQTKENKAKVMIDADTKTNGWFWFTAFLGSFFPILWLLMIYMYFSQKKSSKESFEKVFDRIEFDLKEL